MTLAFGHLINGVDARKCENIPCFHVVFPDVKLFIVTVVLSSYVQFYLTFTNHTHKHKPITSHSEKITLHESACVWGGEI